MSNIMLILHVGVLIIITMVGKQAKCYSLADVQRLKADLLSNSAYDRTMRYIYNQSQAIQVKYIYSTQNKFLHQDMYVFMTLVEIIKTIVH